MEETVQDQISGGPTSRNQSKQVNTPLLNFRAPDKRLSILVSRPKFLKGRNFFGWTEKGAVRRILFGYYKLGDKSYQRLYFRSTWSSRRNALSAKSWSKQVEWKPSRYKASTTDTQPGRAGAGAGKGGPGVQWAHQSRCSFPGLTHIWYLCSEHPLQAKQCMISNRVKYIPGKQWNKSMDQGLYPIHIHMISK